MKKSKVDRKVVEEILGDLETKLAAYVDDWWQELGIRKGSGAGIDWKELQLVATRVPARAFLPAGERERGPRDPSRERLQERKLA